MKKYFYFKRMVLSLLITLTALSISPSNAHAVDTKAADLAVKLDEISSIRLKIMERKVQALKLYDQLTGNMNEFIREILNEKKRFHITSFQEAIKNKRIMYNIQLVQKTISYVSGLKSKINYFNAVNAELEFLFRRVYDALKILGTLDDMEVDDLSHQIHQVFAMYQPEAETLFIDGKDLTTKSSVSIWSDIILTQ